MVRLGEEAEQFVGLSRRNRPASPHEFGVFAPPGPIIGESVKAESVDGKVSRLPRQLGRCAEGGEGVCPSAQLLTGGRRSLRLETGREVSALYV